MKDKFKKLILCIVMLTSIITISIILVNKKEAKACKPKRISIENCEISMEKRYYEYTGKEIWPELKITYRGIELIVGTDYVLSMDDSINAGTATLWIRGTGKYKGIIETEFYINGTDISELKYSYSNGNFLLYDNEGNIINNSNYVMTTEISSEYINNDRCITYIVKGIGKYKGYIYILEKKS